MASSADLIDFTMLVVTINDTSTLFHFVFCFLVKFLLVFGLLRPAYRLSMTHGCILLPS